MNLEDHLGKLAALGSADQIRDFLVERGIKGTSMPGQCPVARYLRAETGAGILVGPRSTFMLQRIDTPPPRPTTDLRARIRTQVLLGDWENQSHPEAVAEFIHRFDHGRYPELKEEEEQ